jgi:thymidine kinase
MAGVEVLLADGGKGSISLIVGPMFAGKSTELLRRLRTASVAALKCCLFRPKVDTRDEKADKAASAAGAPAPLLRTHADQTLDKDDGVSRLWVSTIAEGIAQLADDCKVVAIDEGQFIPDLALGCQVLAQRGVVVIVAALDGDFMQDPFPSVSQLYPKCESVTKLLAWCMVCKRQPASFTVRLSTRMTAEERTTRVDPGGADKFKAVCRRCLPG